MVDLVPLVWAEARLPSATSVVLEYTAVTVYSIYGASEHPIMESLGSHETVSHTVSYLLFISKKQPISPIAQS